jgi:hypothetical protein
MVSASITAGRRPRISLLLDHGADARVVEPHFGGTAADWARHGGHAEIAAMLAQHRSKA